ncbi:MAG: ABC transporter permease [Acidimicrobiales bacterium]
MIPTLVIARLTLHEALRRRLVAAFGAITLCFVGLSAWGFYRLGHSQSLTSGDLNVALPQALVLFMFMFSFVLALSASTIASLAVASEVESGVLHTIVTRPLTRAQVLLGKWTGLATVVLGYAVVVSTLEVIVVGWVSGFTPPDPLAVALYLFAEGVVLMTLVLFLSTRLSALASGVVGIALFGAAWLAGVVGTLGTNFHIGSLRVIGEVSRYVLPTDGLWRGAVYYLEPSSFLTRRLTEVVGGGNPFFVASPPGWVYVGWTAAWFAVVLAAGLVSFERKEL